VHSYYIIHQYLYFVRKVFCLINQNYLGKLIQSSSYTCDQNDLTIEFSLSSSSHSAWDSSSNCSLSQCNSNYNNTCSLSPTPCFDYRTINNQSYCALASLCSLLEPCNDTCSSNTSICIINSCCQPKTRCLPLSWTNICPSSSKNFYFY